MDLSLYLIVMAFVGAAVGVVVTYLAARRVAATPTGADPAAEAALLAAVLLDPDQYRLAVVVEPDDFAWPPHSAIWAAFGELAVDDDDRAHVLEAESYGLPSKKLDFDADGLRDALDDRGLLEDIHPHVFNPPRKPDVKQAGRKVLEAASLREIPGPSPIDAGDSPREPLVRRVATPRVSRRVLAGAVGTLGGAGVAYAASGPVQTVAGLVMLAAALVVSLVDIDTLYIDYPALAFMYVATAVVSVATVIDGNVWWVAAAAICAAVYAVMLELIAWLWSKLRGMDGLGGGDTVLLLPSVMFPIAATGVVAAGVWGFFAAVILSLIVQGSIVVSGRANRYTHFPFGPYLAAIWIFGWVLVVSGHGL